MTIFIYFIFFPVYLEEEKGYNPIMTHQGNTTFNTEEIEIHIRTYRSLLKSAGEVKISQLMGSHTGMKSVLHEKAGGKKVDLAAFIYVLLRLPTNMSQIKNVILGQSFDVFSRHGFKNIDSWEEKEAPGRRRKMFFDSKETLAVYIASVTDVDDIITLLTAFEIEWNKFHSLIKETADVEKEAEEHFAPEDLGKIKNIWGMEYHKFLTAIKYRKVEFNVKLLSGSYVEYAKSTRQWWKNIDTTLKNLKIKERPVYFVSSNTHSLVNLLTRFVLYEKNKLITFLYKTGDSNLIRLWEEIQSGDFKASEEHFLYYIAKKYAKVEPDFMENRLKMEKELGIYHIPASHYLDIDTQVVELSKLAGIKLDSRIEISTQKLEKSDALLFNIDYPLGWAAYQVLTEIGQNAAGVRGIYIMGKAATLNGQIGDILIPNSVFDQHTKNIFVFQNCFKREDFDDIFATGMVLDHQKTVAVKGTFMESDELIRKWYKEGYTILEMETGPYLNAVYEFIYYNRYMENQFVNLTNAPFDLGIVHYASDTPYSKAKNLGVRNLSYEGIEPTYAISLAIIKKIIERETKSY